MDTIQKGVSLGLTREQANIIDEYFVTARHEGWADDPVGYAKFAADGEPELQRVRNIDKIIEQMAKAGRISSMEDFGPARLKRAAIGRESAQAPTGSPQSNLQLAYFSSGSKELKALESMIRSWKLYKQNAQGEARKDPRLASHLKAVEELLDRLYRVEYQWKEAELELYRL